MARLTFNFVFFQQKVFNECCTFSNIKNNVKQNIHQKNGFIFKYFHSQENKLV